MTAIAQAERYASQDFPCYGAQLVGWQETSRFMPWFCDGRRVYWGWATDTRSEAMNIAHGMAEQIGLP